MRAGDQTAMNGRYPDGVPVRPGEVTWPLLSGLIPQLADSYVPRQETGLGLAATLAPGDTAVLIPADEANRTLGGLGGTGKTQLALAVAHTLWDRHALDLVLWLTPSSRDAVITGYAQAMQDVGRPSADGPEAAAAHFLDWLSETGRPWLVILDDLADASALEGLWPHGPQGRVMVTSRRPDTAVRAYRPRAVEVGPFSPRESLAYLSSKLHADPDQWIGALDLAGDLGHLPIALAQAAALMADTGLDCRQYRTRVADRMQRLAGGAAGAYLSRYRRGAPVDEMQARAVLFNLARAGLLGIDTTSAARTVRVHSVVQATVQQNLTAAESDEAARAAAEALFQAWPRTPVPASFEQALRDCTTRLQAAVGRVLWTPECHPVLLRAGRSLEAAGLTDAATGYWRSMLETSQAELGPNHTHTIMIRDRLGAAHEAAGRSNDAVEVYQESLNERQRILGAGHPDTVTARANLARAYRSAGRANEAVELAERVLAESEQGRGARHPDTLTAREELGEAYLGAGLGDRAIAAFQRTLADRERVLGQTHPDTLAARTDLAHAYRAAGQPEKALPLHERLVADRERSLGPDHSETLAAQGNLAYAYRSSGRLKDALPVYRRTLAGRERAAVSLYGRTLAAREARQGRDHPDPITARGNLASAYHSARKLAQAIPLYEENLADCERVFGPDHPNTLTSRSNLAHAYHTVGRYTEAQAMFERTLADAERALGPDHPLTQTARENLAAATQA